VLPVSDLLEVARNGLSDAELRERTPDRYGSTDAAPVVVVWNVCLHCNMTCPHCYAAAVSTPCPTDLTTAEGFDLLEQLAACGVRTVIFSGGEPLMRDDLFELLGRARSLGLASQLSTNGVLVDEATAARLAAAGVGYVGISIDGVAAFNDAYRGAQGGHDAAIRGLRLARAAGMRIGMRMTLTRRNVDQLEAMVQEAIEVEADRFYVSHLLYSGRGYRMSGDDLPRATARAALRDLFRLAENLLLRGEGPRIVTGSNDSDGVFFLQWIERRYGAEAARPVRLLLRARGGNSAGERILNVDSRGRVHPDQFWRSALLGDVRRQRFAEILRHPLRQQLRNRLDHLEGRCARCSERELCRGSHRERALAIEGDPWASDPACVMEDREIGLGSGLETLTAVESAR
jgi:radical SAM protein with 4Fe4S-binding SPASM domain